MKALPVLLLLLAACDDGDKKEPQTFTFTEDVQTTDNGYIDTFVEVKSGMRSFFVSAESEDWLVVSSITDPNGTVVLDGGAWSWETDLLTMAVFAMEGEQAVNWPIRAVDPPLEAGTWQVTLVAYDDQWDRVNGHEIRLDRYTNRDDNLTKGTLNVRLVWAEGLDEDAALVASVESAVEGWRDIYSQAGLGLVTTFETSDLDPDLPRPGTGDPEIQAVAERGSPQQITVMLGETVDDRRGILGEAGGIPGNLTPTGHAAVGVALFENAGRDLTFDEDEIEMLSMTFAHEVGHYLGLFHVVECTWDYFDALEDTPDCHGQNDCIDALAENLMFCMAMCDFTSCMVQEDITDNQIGVLQRYTGVL